MGFFYLVNKKSKVNRKSSEIRIVKQQSRSAVHHEDEPDITDEGNESYLEGKRWSPTQMFVLCEKPNEHLCTRREVKY